MILLLRTDQPEAEVRLYDASGQEVERHSWLAHRQLARDLLAVIRDRLAARHKTFNDLTAIIVFRGPGSFTGLRIGITVANALAYGQNIPVVGSLGHEWIAQGLERLNEHHNDSIVLPEYGAEARITTPKK